MLDGIPIVGLTAPTLLGVAILLILLGKLVPKPTHDQALEEARRWREAYEIERQSRQEAVDGMRELVEVAQTTHNVTAAMFDMVREHVRQTGGTSNVPSSPES